MTASSPFPCGCIPDHPACDCDIRTHREQGRRDRDDVGTAGGELRTKIELAIMGRTANRAADAVLALPALRDLLAERDTKSERDDTLYLDGIRTENSETVITAHGAEQTLAHMALAMRTFFEANDGGGSNYIQSGVVHEGKTWNFVVYPAGRPTPHDLRRKAEAERDTLAAQVQAVEELAATWESDAKRHNDAEPIDSDGLTRMILAARFLRMNAADLRRALGTPTTDNRP